MGTSSGTLVFTNAGTFQLPDIVSIQYGLGSVTNLPVLSDGSVVVVDSSGLVLCTQGPRLMDAVMDGFVLSFVTLGVVLAITWVWRRMFRAGSIPGGAFE